MNAPIFSCETLKNKKAFTLVEILIVMGILGVIFGLLAPRFGDSQKKSKMKEAKIQIGLISNALATYNMDCGKYPASLDGLVKADDCANWGPTSYYTKKLKDPWNRDYSYELNGGEFVLKSLGGDGKEGGAGFDKDISSEDDTNTGESSGAEK
ncbi:MAG: type II secretion system major pseudopilin GspG [Bdellovibrionota bacterium]